MIIYTTPLAAKVQMSNSLRMKTYTLSVDMYAYILDTGIYAEHQEFEGRAVCEHGLQDTIIRVTHD